MTNVKTELLNVIKNIENKGIMCAEIILGNEWCDDRKTFSLKVDYSIDDYEIFLDSLDFEYDAGYGSQNLFGIVWFHDAWLERHEYDGAECWVYKKKPAIPNHLK